MSDYKLSDQIRNDRELQTLTGKIEYVGINMTQKGFEGPYAVMSLKNEKTKVRIIGESSTDLKNDDIVSVKVSNPKNVERGMWNTTIEEKPVVLKRESESKLEPVLKKDDPLEKHEMSIPPQSESNKGLLTQIAMLRWDRPTTNIKIANMLNITEDKVSEITADPEYTEVVQDTLLESLNESAGKVKMKNYIRMAIQYRKVCVKQALARKMRLSIDDATDIIEVIQTKLQ